MEASSDKKVAVSLTSPKPFPQMQDHKLQVRGEAVRLFSVYSPPRNEPFNKASDEAPYSDYVNTGSNFFSGGWLFRS